MKEQFFQRIKDALRELIEFEHLNNRDKKLSTTKNGQHWCDRCDGELVGRGGKCWGCGKRQDKRKFKR